jgi:hypothetical protein
MWALYTAEAFPKRSDDGWVDYLQGLGVQVVLKAHEWTPLLGEDGDGLLWRITYHNNWIDAAGDAKETTVTCKQVAERITGQFRLRGVRCADLDRITPAQKAEIEKDSEDTNLKFRELFIKRFEHQARLFSLGQPGGRATPTPYEEECYKILGKKVPDFGVSSQPIQGPETKVIIQEPNPELIALLVQQELARLTAPGPKGT